MCAPGKGHLTGRRSHQGRPLAPKRITTTENFEVLLQQIGFTFAPDVVKRVEGDAPVYTGPDMLFLLQQQASPCS